MLIANMIKIMSATPAFPKVLSAETNIYGTTITVTFDKAMSDPAGKQSQFGVGV